MQSFELSRVPAIFFGAGCHKRLKREVAARIAPGGAVMIIADPVMEKLGWTEHIFVAMLAETEIRAAVYADLAGEPKVAEIDRATAAARALPAELIMGSAAARRSTPPSSSRQPPGAASALPPMRCATRRCRPMPCRSSPSRARPEPARR